MRVVLLKDVPGVGQKGEIKTVSDGHALNFLIPRKLAEMGTPAAIAKAERAKTQAVAERRIQADLLAKNLATLDGTCIEMSGRANDKGHLFSGIHQGAIASALKKQTGIDVLPEFIVLAHPIKEVGEHTVSVRAHDIGAAFTLAVKSL